VVLLALSGCFFGDETHTRLRNDLGSSATVTVCPHQECSGVDAVTLKADDVIKVAANRSDRVGDTPDSVEVMRGDKKRCLLISMPSDSRRTIKLSEADEATC
jgi:hypothetical protein